VIAIMPLVVAVRCNLEWFLHFVLLDFEIGGCIESAMLPNGAVHIHKITDCAGAVSMKSKTDGRNVGSTVAGKFYNKKYALLITRFRSTPSQMV
jgi:hypothetical protein